MCATHVPLFLLAVAVPFVHGSFLNDSLSLLVTVPLTRNNVNTPDPGWIQLAAALLAVDHFNTRNPKVVSFLAELDDCDITIGNVSVLDTGTNDHLAIEELTSSLRTMPHAIVGPYNEIPALELSVLATVLKIPIVSHRSVDSNLLIPAKHPFFSQVSADPLSEMAFLGSYLNHTRRINYIAVVYCISATTLQKVDILRVILDKGGMNQVRTFTYNNGDDELAQVLPDVSILSALKKVKETGFRTIVWINEDMRKDAPLIHQAASSLQLDRGGHFWVFSGGTAQLSSTEQVEFLRYSRRMFGAKNFMTGAAFLMPHEGISLDMNFRSPFEEALMSLDRSFIERLEAATPIPNYYNWSYAANQDKTMEVILDRLGIWWQGTSYIYDATMAVAIGACEAARTARINGTKITGQDHLVGIRSVNFHGATGRIAFRGVNSGSRIAGTEPMVVVNLLPPGRNETLFWMTEMRDLDTGFITTHGVFYPFVYANGSYYPPHLLRDTPNQNYLSKQARVTGLSFMAYAFLVIALGLLWIYRHRHHSVVIASPPIYLKMLCVGAAVLAFDIWVSSHDEGQGWDNDMLDAACIASFWGRGIGAMTIYGSMFTKHWRVDLLIRLKSNRIEIWRMAWPIVLFSTILVIVMACFTLQTDYGWYRIEDDEVSGESHGLCTTGNDTLAWSTYIVPILLLVPVFQTARMAYKTLEMDELYSESKWVLVFILLQLQVFLVGIPATLLLEGTSTDGAFIGEVLLLWTVSVSTIGLIIFPKVWKVRQMHLKAVEAEAEPRDGRIGDGSVERSIEPVSVPPDLIATPVPRGNGPLIQIVTFD